MEYTPPLPATAHAPEEENDMSAETDTQTTTVYRVTGMTCGHCEGAVTGELTALPGVTSVKAVAATGEVTVISTAPLDEDVVRAAVDEAGYELAGQA